MMVDEFVYGELDMNSFMLVFLVVLILFYLKYVMNFIILFVISRDFCCWNFF